MAWRRRRDPARDEEEVASRDRRAPGTVEQVPDGHAQEAAPSNAALSALLGNERVRRPSASGAPLDAAVRAEMEGRLGGDLADVRIHTGPGAADAARALDARAFTSESDVVFGHRQYRPNTVAGRELLTHELVHVLQQHFGPDSGAAVSERRDPAEVEARSIASDPARSDADRVSEGASALVSRQEDTATEAATDTTPEPMSLDELLALIPRIVFGIGLDDLTRRRMEITVQRLADDAFSALFTTLAQLGVLDDLIEILGPVGQTLLGEMEVELKVDCFVFAGVSPSVVDQDVDFANEIYNRYGITITKASVTRVPGWITDLVIGSDRMVEREEGEERRAIEWLNSIVGSRDLEAYWAVDFEQRPGSTLFGTSFPDWYRERYAGNEFVIIGTAVRRADTFAHEIGHIVMDEGHAGGASSTVFEDEGEIDEARAPSNLMTSGSTRTAPAVGSEFNPAVDRLTSEQILRAKTSVYAWIRRSR
jgi:hypothetical protein